jgi:hypothetical protein
MEHACYKCRQMIEEGTPFCAHCGAPQIRVTIAAPPAATPATNDALSVPDHVGASATSGISAISLPVPWSHAVQPCALAAAVAIMLTLLGLNPFVTMLGSGVLAVAFNRYRNPLTPMRAGAGARLGALSGLIGFAISAVLSALFIVVFHKGPEIRDFMVKNLQQNAARYPGPEYQAALDLVRSPAGLALVMVFSLIFGFVVFVVLSSLGGALAGAFLGHRNPR